MYMNHPVLAARPGVLLLSLHLHGKECSAVNKIVSDASQHPSACKSTDIWGCSCYQHFIASQQWSAVDMHAAAAAAAARTMVHG